MTTTNCPCGQHQNYENCCQPLHLNQQQAGNAETLMRSRYSAFVKQDIDYLIRTLHPGQRRDDDRQTLLHTCQNTRWLGLQILSAVSDQHRAEVEFVAFYEDEPLGQLHERSRFICNDGHWQYIDGTFLPAVKIARNTLCPCGSDKKFKHCHGR